MQRLFDQRRYLIPFRSSLLPQIFCDTLIIGPGVAGLRAAITAAERGEVIVLGKAALDLTNTNWAQGGVAAVLDAGRPGGGPQVGGRRVAENGEHGAPPSQARRQYGGRNEGMHDVVGPPDERGQSDETERLLRSDAPPLQPSRHDEAAALDEHSVRSSFAARHAGRAGDDADVVPRSGEVPREILEVTLRAAAHVRERERMSERDLHRSPTRPR